MKYKLTLFILFFSMPALYAQETSISTIDFVEILNNNRSEARYYYEHNWKVLREMALAKGWIDSYQLLEITPDPKAPFQLLLITTFKNQKQYDERESHFQELIREKGELILLNEKKPAEFRKTLFSSETVTQHP